MGFAYCRFREETGCQEKGSREYHIFLKDLKVKINVPSMWKHYAVNHLVQPTKEERDIVMNADSAKAQGMELCTMGIPRPGENFMGYKSVLIMYVEKTPGGYTHEVGNAPDTAFISKLEKLLENMKPIQTKTL
jgi:hypothetical protein